jgi:dethiobiotin synthetase
LRARGIPLLGVAFIGDENAESERIIADMGHVRRLGRLPHLEQVTCEELRAAFAVHFDVRDFLKGSAG